ncbi:hypothetical protein Vafri_5754 [Volvox africanus]|nr:hypothetical protein Vafri_5754 [Volvox africanus]
MEDRLLHEAAAAAAAYQQYYQQQKLQQSKLHPLVAAVRWVLYFLDRMPAPYRGWRPRVQLYLLLSCPEYSFLAMAIGVLMMAVVLLNTLTFCLESVPSLEGTRMYDNLIIIDYVCLGIFTTEFLLRLLTCNSVLRFARNFMNWVDLVAVLPFLVELAVAGPDSQSASKTRIFRIVRLLRVLRLLRASTRWGNWRLMVKALSHGVRRAGALSVGSARNTAFGKGLNGLMKGLMKGREGRIHRGDAPPELELLASHRTRAE